MTASWASFNLVPVSVHRGRLRDAGELIDGRQDVRSATAIIVVESLDATISELAARGIDAEAPVSPDGSDDFRTTWVTDPDGNRIELVQWPAGHADGITAADWPE